MPRDYLQLLSERDDFPIDVTLLDAVEALAARRQKAAEREKMRRELDLLEREVGIEEEGGYGLGV